MSRSKKKSAAKANAGALPGGPNSADEDARPDPADDATTDDAQTSLEAQRVSPRTVFIAATLVVLAWYVFLISIAATTGNPITLNRVQLEESRVIIAGRVDAGGHVQVDQEFKGRAPAREFELADFPYPAGRYILPLRPGPDGIEITPSRLPNKARLIYPATPESIRQLEELLTEEAG